MSVKKIKIGAGNEDNQFVLLNSTQGYKTNGVVYPRTLYSNTALPIKRSTDGVQIGALNIEIDLMSPTKASMCFNAGNHTVPAAGFAYCDDIPAGTMSLIAPKTALYRPISLVKAGAQVNGILVITSTQIQFYMNSDFSLPVGNTVEFINENGVQWVPAQ